jgi:AcrR family transcriptional regulator
MEAAFAHLEPRTDLRAQEILERIRPVVSAKGFEGSSMQDLAQAAGMSAGNFYRYFPSKAALIEALVLRDLEDAERSFERIRRSDEPRKVMRELIMERLTGGDCDSGLLWAEVEAAAGRRPEIGALLRRLEAIVLSNIIEVLARLAGVAKTEAERRFRAHARLIHLLVHGFWAETCRPKSEAEHKSDLELAELVLQSIDTIIAGMAAPRDAANGKA